MEPDVLAGSRSEVSRIDRCTGFNCRIHGGPDGLPEPHCRVAESCRIARALCQYRWRSALSGECTNDRSRCDYAGGLVRQCPGTESAMRNDSRVSQLLALEAKRNIALLNKDMEFLESALDDDLTYVHASGKIDSKRTLLENIEKNLTYSICERGELHVRVFGDVGVMTGSTKIVTHRHGASSPTVIDGNITQVWVLRGGSWRMVAYHANRNLGT